MAIFGAFEGRHLGPLIIPIVTGILPPQIRSLPTDWEVPAWLGTLGPFSKNIGTILQKQGGYMATSTESVPRGRPSPDPRRELSARAAYAAGLRPFPDARGELLKRVIEGLKCQPFPHTTGEPS